MQKFLSLLLIVVTYWMSTWMVTDIHNVILDGDQLHPNFSVHSPDSGIHFQSDGNASPDCQICSYDHGGHFGQILVANVHVVALSTLDTEYHSACPFNWLTHITPTKHRPPIA